MKVTTERLPESQMLLHIEAEPAEMEAAVGRALRRLASRVRIPGFRGGKAPPQVVESFLGREAVLDEAVQDLVPQLYRQAVEENGLEPIDQPQMEVVSTDPLKVKATVPLRPTVSLGDYHQVQVEPEKVEVPDMEVVRRIEAIRYQQAPWQPVAGRPIHFGDLLTLEAEGREDGRLFLKEQDMEYLLLPDNPTPVPGFARQLEGLLPGESREFSLSFPSTDPREELAGKTYSFKVVVTEAKEKALPPLDDDFAQAAGFDSLAALREKVTGEVREQAEAAAQARFEEKVVDAVVAQARVEYPPVLVEQEVDRLLQEEVNRLRQGRLSLEDYLRGMRQTVEQFRGELRPLAEQRLRRALVLGKVAEAEGIQVTPEEVDAEVRSLAQRAGEQAAQVQQAFDTPQGRTAIERRLLGRKTVDRLVEIARSRQEQTTPSGLILPGGVPPAGERRLTP